MNPNSVCEAPISIKIPFYGEVLDGRLESTASAHGTVALIFGSIGGCLSSVNSKITEIFGKAGLNTLLMDLLTEEETEIDSETQEFRFDTALLAGRCTVIVHWMLKQLALNQLPIGLFGASNGAAAALTAAAELPNVAALAVCGTGPDLAGVSYERIQAPTLVIGCDQEQKVDLRRKPLGNLFVQELCGIRSTTLLFENPDILEQAAEAVAQWFALHLSASRSERRVSSIETRIMA